MDIPATFPCLGKIYNCTTDSPADPDVVGIGVMAAFLATSIATFATILIAYFCGYLPGIEPNDIDYLLLRKPRGELQHESPEIKKRKDAVEAFILTLSDQQLVTGLAILIAGFVKCDISVYSFENVSALAWFSCTMHLATLTILKRYLRKHKFVLALRIIGMLLIAGLLIASNFMVTTAKSTARAWKQESVGLERSLDVCFYCIFNSGARRTPGSFGIDIIILLWLLYAYPSRVHALFASEDPRFRRKWNDPKDCRRRLYRIPDEHHRKLYGRVTRICNREVSDSQKDLVCRLYLALFLGQELTHSYWWEILWLLFAGAFSLSRVLMVWLSFSDISGRHRVLSEASTAMGFGQMAALLFLALPCFAALEAFSGQEETKVTTEEPELKAAEPEEEKLNPRMVFDPVTQTIMTMSELLKLEKEREEEIARQHINSHEGSYVEREQDGSPERKESRPISGRGSASKLSQEAALEPTSLKTVLDLSSSNSIEQIRPREEVDNTSKLSHEAAMEVSALGDLQDLSAISWGQLSFPEPFVTEVEPTPETSLHKRLLQVKTDAYQVDGYKQLSVIFSCLCSMYIVGIGVTMAIAPNIRTLVYVSVPLMPEASVRVVRVAWQVRQDWQMYRTVVVSRTMRRDLERAANEVRLERDLHHFARSQRSYGGDREHYVTRG